MPGRFIRTLFVLFLISTVHGQLTSSDDNKQSLIDQILQVIWEPSSLIRVWVGLDQLFNIARSWRGVAKKLASLPFGGDGENHVRIQEPRTMKYQKPSVGSQLDRFNHMYSSSNLSPIVAHARGKQFKTNPYNSFKALGSNLHAVKANPTSNGLKLPPPFLFQPQEVFYSDWAKLFQKMGGVDYSTLFRKGPSIKHFSPYNGAKNVEPTSPFQNTNGFRYPTQLEQLQILKSIAYMVHQFQNGNKFGFDSRLQPMNSLQHTNQLKNVNSHSVPFQNSITLEHLTKLANMNGQMHPRPFQNLNTNSRGQFLTFDTRVAAASKLAGLQNQDRNMLLKFKNFQGSSIVHHPSVKYDDPMMKMTPQERLNMFLMLMKALGTMNTRKIATINDLKLGARYKNYAESMNRNDVRPFHTENFVDRDILETHEKK